MNNPTITKAQFKILIDGLVKQFAFEKDFDKAIGKLNSSWTICNLSSSITEAVTDYLNLAFDTDVSDLITDYVFVGAKVAVFYDEDQDIDIKEQCETADQLYDIIIKWYCEA